LSLYISTFKKSGAKLQPLRKVVPKQPFLKIKDLAQPFLKVVLAQPFLKVVD